MKKFNAIAFDLDSTLVTIEGLDWLAKNKGVEDQVKQVTEDSMNGALPVELAFEIKMSVIAPSYAEVETLGQMYLQSFVSDAKETVAALQAAGKEVWIVTGNFNPAPQIVANHLGIPDSHVFSNKMLFGKDQQYQGYDTSHPLTKNGGKAVMVRDHIRKNGKRIAFVGDAVTDLETKPYVDLFIGFGGVAERTLVKEKADVYISEKSLKPLLDILLTDEEKNLIGGIVS